MINLPVIRVKQRFYGDKERSGEGFAKGKRLEIKMDETQQRDLARNVIGGGCGVLLRGECAARLSGDPKYQCCMRMQWS
jgi:hypothetical protein